MLRTKRQGFTLIELMVVVVIIGVLASLAIPRFTEASDKAKAADAPRVMASFESAFLAALAEKAGTNVGVTEGDMIFKTPDSRWFDYVLATAPAVGQAPAHSAGKLEATPKGKIGQILPANILSTTFCNDDDDKFGRNIVDGTAGYATLKSKYFANFLPDIGDRGCAAATPPATPPATT